MGGLYISWMRHPPRNRDINSTGMDPDLLAIIRDGHLSKECFKGV